MARAATGLVNLWQIVQWKSVCPAILPSLIWVSSVRWQPFCTQVESAGRNRWAVRAWQVRHSTFPFSADESDSRWVRWPAVEAIACQVSFAAP